MQSNDDNINRQDPLERLPQELITHSLLFLPPTSRCVSNAISKDWRETVLSIPLLHQEIDLSRMGQDPKIDISPQDPLFALGTPIFKYSLLKFLPIESLISSALVSKQWRRNLSSHWTILGEDRGEILRRLVDRAQLNRILFHLDRISSLALNRVTKLSIDLSSFVQEFNVWSKGDQQEAWSSIGLGRLSAALLNCEESLKEIDLRVNPEAPGDVAPMLVSFLEQLIPFGKLNRIEVKAPMLAALAAQGQVEGNFKSISIVSMNEWNILGFSGSSSYYSMVRQVEAFVGPQACFTRMCLKDLKIFEKLEISKSTLRELDLGRLSPTDLAKAWDLAMGCFQLSASSFNFLRLRDTEPEEFVCPSEGPTSLKKLNFCGYPGQSVSCSAMAKWIGNQLEEITLAFLVMKASPDELSTHLFSILLSCKDTLKLIHLTGIQVDQQDYPEIEKEELFPNLENLKTDLSSHSPLQFFSRMKLPKLKKFHSFVMIRDSSSLVCTLMTLLNRCSSSLIVIDLAFEDSDDLQVRIQEFSDTLSFPRLESLTLGMFAASESSQWTQWFSRFSYPSLVELTPINEIIYRQFRKNAPKLTLDRLSKEIKSIVNLRVRGLYNVETGDVGDDDSDL